MDSLAREAVDLIHETYGRHEGRRAVHSKGTVCSGTRSPRRPRRHSSRAPPTCRAGPSGSPTRFSNGAERPVDPGLRPGRPRDSHNSTCPMAREQTSSALALRLSSSDPRLLKFTRAGKAAAGDQPAGAPLGFICHPPRGAAGGSAVPGAQAPAELRPAALKRAPRVPLGRHERRGAQRPLQLAARSGRSHDLQPRGQGRRPGLSPGGYRRALAPGTRPFHTPGSAWRRGRSGR